MAYSFLEGNLYSAFFSNPLLFLTVIVFISVLGFKLIFAKKIKFELRRYEKIVLGILAIASFIANWAYIIIRDYET